MSMTRSKYFQDSDDPFSFIRKIFIDYGYSKKINYYNRVTFTFNTCSILLESYYMITNFSLDLFVRYGGALSLMLYHVVTQFLVIAKQKSLEQLLEESKSYFWKADIFNSSVKNQILKSCNHMQRKFCLLWTPFVACGIVLLPVWGDFTESHIFPQVYKAYFGHWSPIFYYFCISSYPFAVYTSIRLPAIALYLFLQAHFQIVLLNQKILQISKNNDLDETTIFENMEYQKTIYRNLRSCISQHVALQKYITRILVSIQKAIPVYFCLAVLCLIAVIFFVLNNLNMSASNHFKARIFVSGVCGSLILYTFTEAGQLLADTTGDIFNTLMQCPWYYWNIKNRTVFMIFMLHSLNPLKIDWGGFTLGYSFGGAVIRTCCSYAVGLYNLRESKY
ncbi:odorant receptor 199 [Tribolium castaneum]|uniref:Odorant receptor n=1 Tax=Tribolium castaneum TaxID=7070 RepID=D6X403_TRICA|nr:odorant receptor 199 [Tribolium castaneum]